ncbi:AAA family ATPase [Haloplanus halobius]|uniref:AAA family ATPase n=1 Tax=Haloplanus halobius TaxID=2934938 RepID=UPI00200BFF26|nr:MoxR family ATPase [Haloplanus sp. XH21]
MSDTDPVETPRTVYTDIRDAVESVLIGNDPIIRGLTISLLTGGHVLIEGVPGVGKTTGARLFARATGLDYGRIQMTPDVLPADITGTEVYREHTGEFDLQRGPIFANVVVADEINRATPKTQSALLEAMQERTVTIGGDTLSLPDPFLVIATQNPIEYEGTFSLPEAQRDRFQFKLIAGIPDRDDETELLDRFDEHPDLGADDIDQAVTREQLASASRAVEEVYVAPEIKEYILDLVDGTRTTDQLAHGASPRAALDLLQAAKGNAALEGRDYAIPDDVKSLALMTLGHRLVLSTDAELSERSARDIIQSVIDDTSVPSVDTGFEPSAVADD